VAQSAKTRRPTNHFLRTERKSGAGVRAPWAAPGRARSPDSIESFRLGKRESRSTVFEYQKAIGFQVAGAAGNTGTIFLKPPGHSLAAGG
jgi:hypothetical protein